MSKNPRVSEADRTKIVKACMLDTRAKVIDELLAEGQQIVLWILEEHAPEAVLLLHKIKSPWLNRCAYFTVNGEGFVQFSFSANHHYATRTTYDRYFPAQTDQNIRLKGALAHKVATYRNRWGDAIAQYETTQRNLYALLKQCKTLKDLETLWPEGEPYYKFIRVEPPAKRLLPMVDVAALNSALGLPKETRS